MFVVADFVDAVPVEVMKAGAVKSANVCASYITCAIGRMRLPGIFFPFAVKFESCLIGTNVVCKKNKAGYTVTPVACG